MEAFQWYVVSLIRKETLQWANPCDRIQRNGVQAQRLFISKSDSAGDRIFFLVTHIGAGQQSLALGVFTWVAHRLKSSTAEVETLTVHLEHIVCSSQRLCLQSCANQKHGRLSSCPLSALRVYAVDCLRSAQQVSVPSPSPAPGRGPPVTLFRESRVSSSSPLSCCGPLSTTQTPLCIPHGV